MAVTPADIKIGFTTTLTDPEIQAYITEATNRINAELEIGGITNPAVVFATSGTYRLAIIEKTQCMILGADLSSGIATGPVKSVQEGSEKITYATGEKETTLEHPCDLYVKRLAALLRKNAPGRQPFIQAVTKRVGHTVVDGGDWSSDLERPPEE